MSWDEFKDLLSGLAPDTPLGRVVSIRAEDDKEVLKHFSKDDHRIRDEWRKKSAQKVTQVEMDAFLEQMKNAFIYMAK